jgi:predicted DNA-binding transcriptional regulator AlpA
MNTSIYVDLKEVIVMTTLSRSTIDRQMKKGIFPKKIYVSPRCVRWLRSEVEDWQQSRKLARDGGATDKSTVKYASYIPNGIDTSEVKLESSG